MALTKIITDTIDLSSDTTALKMPKGSNDNRGVLITQTIDYLVVAGGGSGGWYYGGGGGAGGYITSSTYAGGGSTGAALSLYTETSYTITVGLGGAGGSSSSVAGHSPNGENSVFASLTAIGGGGGGVELAGAPYYHYQGGNGGSGGGGARDGALNPIGNPGGYGEGTTNQGNNGGTSQGTGWSSASGGGGADAVGGNGSTNGSGSDGGPGGNGGAGRNNTITGTGVDYAGGGGGSAGGNTPGSGGLGGGGAGSDSGTATSGTANTGGGGGGTKSGTAGSGGKGIIIIRVPNTITATFSSGVTSTLDTSVASTNIYSVTATTGSCTVTFTDSTLPSVAIGTMRENTTTGKMEIYTGAKGWRALQQTGQDVSVVPSNNFNTVLWTSTGNTDISITGVGFKPDLVWAKSRSNAYNHTLYDSVRGTGTNHWLASDGDWTESYLASSAASYGYLSSFDNDGFTSTTGSVDNSYFNYNTGNNYVAWNWKAGGSSNTFNIDGVGYATAAAASMNTGTNPPSACSVNTELGFSIIKNTSPAGAYTWDHGLNKAPELWIHKSTDYTYGWETMIPSASLWGNSSGSLTPADWLYLRLDLTNAATASTYYSANDTLLSSGGWGQVNEFITYAWHSVPGYSLIGSYTGTGSATDNPIIYTGFEPAWILIKRTDVAANWRILDNKRSTTNPINKELYPNLNNAEGTWTALNFYSNGFQLINTDASYNAGGGTYIFMCFAS